MVQNWESKKSLLDSQFLPRKAKEVPVSGEASKAILLATKENHYIGITFFEKESFSVVTSSDLLNSQNTMLLKQQKTQHKRINLRLIFFFKSGFLG